MEIDCTETPKHLRLVERVVELGAEVPAEHWEKIEAQIGRLLESDLQPRDLARIANIHRGREQIRLAALSRALDEKGSESSHNMERHASIGAAVREYLDQPQGSQRGLDDRPFPPVPVISYVNSQAAEVSES